MSQADTHPPPELELSDEEELERQVNVARQIVARMGDAERAELCAAASRAVAPALAAIERSAKVICAALPKFTLTPEQIEAAERWEDAPEHILKRYGHLTPLELDREMQRQSTMRQATVLHLRHARESRPRTAQRRATTSGTRGSPASGSSSDDDPAPRHDVAAVAP